MHSVSSPCTVPHLCVHLSEHFVVTSSCFHSVRVPGKGTSHDPQHLSCYNSSMFLFICFCFCQVFLLSLDKSLPLFLLLPWSSGCPSFSFPLGSGFALPSRARGWPSILVFARPRPEEGMQRRRGNGSATEANRAWGRDGPSFLVFKELLGVGFGLPSWSWGCPGFCFILGFELLLLFRRSG